MKFPLPLVLLLTLSGSAAISSAATTVPFTITLVTVPEGNTTLQIGQQFSGAVSYSAVIPPVGDFTLSHESNSTVTLSFDFAGDNYSHEDDTSHPYFPEIFFRDGQIRGIAYEAANKSADSLPDGFVGIETSNFLFYSFDGNIESEAIVTWHPPVTAPEPSSILLFSASSLFVAFRRRRVR